MKYNVETLQKYRLTVKIEQNSLELTDRIDQHREQLENNILDIGIESIGNPPINVNNDKTGNNNLAKQKKRIYCI